MSEKLKPEQRKLWRRIYLAAFESGSTCDEAERMADYAVRQWERRGAFDEDSQRNTPSTWDEFAKEVSRKLRDG